MNYFEGKINKNYAIDLFTDVNYEFFNKEGKLPTENQFQQFVLQQKKELIESIERLTSIERQLFFDKLKKEYSGEYPGLRKYYLEHIEVDTVLFNKEFPELEFNKDVSLELVEKIENKYSLYSFFESAKSHLLKFVIQLETQILPPQPIETKTELTPMNLKIGKAFGFMKGNDPRKHEKILNETDFNNLIEWITYFFENSFEVPKISEPIKKVNTSKGNVIYTFMSFYKSEHPEKTRPDSLFELIKACFKEYRNDELDNLKKTKKPQYYDALINENK